MITRILITYFLRPNLRARELFKIEEKRDIHNSKLSSKQFLESKYVILHNGVFAAIKVTEGFDYLQQQI